MIETNRLILRKIEADDYIDIFNNWANDVNVTKYLTWYPHKNIEQTKEIVNSWVEEYNKRIYYHYAIVLKTIEPNQVIGTIGQVGKSWEESGTIEIGYCLSKKYWNQGIMSEALAGLIKYLFSKDEIKEVMIKCNQENIASSSVMKKNGLKLFNTYKQYSNKMNKIVIMEEYKITKEEYKKS